MLGNHLVDGAAEVQIDEVGFHPIDNVARGLSEPLRFRPEKLHTDGPLDGRIEVQHLPRAFAAMQDALGGNELRGQDIRAHLLAELAEDGIRHSRHGGEK